MRYINPDSDEAIMLRFEDLRSRRTGLEGLWKTSADAIAPDLAYSMFGNINSSEEGQRQLRDRTLNSTPTVALYAFASNMQESVAPSGASWFRLTSADQSLIEELGEEAVEKAKLFYGAASDIMHSVLREPTSGFVTALYESFLELALFGVAAIYVTYDEVSGNILFYKRHMSGVYIEEDHFNRVDTVFYRSNMTNRQVLARWGGKYTVEEQRVMGTDMNLRREILHMVTPMEKPMATAVGEKRFSSVYFDVEHRRRLEDDSFYEMPYLIVRWLRTSADSVYGSSLGLVASHDANLLQDIEETILEAAQKNVNPPLIAPNSASTSGFRLHPGAVTYVNTNETGSIRPLINLGGDVSGTIAVKEMTERRINEIFMLHLFQLPDRTGMTATEIAQRTSLQARVLGPTMGRVHRELLDPLVARLFGLLYRSGQLPELPPELSGQKMRIKYVSFLAQAQQASEAASIARMTEYVGMAANFDPGVLSVFDMKAAVRKMAENLAVPEDVIRTLAEVDKIERQAQDRAKQQEEAMLAQQASEANRNNAQAAAAQQPRQ